MAAWMPFCREKSKEEKKWIVPEKKYGEMKFISSRECCEQNRMELGQEWIFLHTLNFLKMNASRWSPKFGSYMKIFQKIFQV